MPGKGVDRGGLRGGVGGPGGVGREYVQIEVRLLEVGRCRMKLLVRWGENVEEESHLVAARGCLPTGLSLPLPLPISHLSITHTHTHTLTHTPVLFLSLPSPLSLWCSCELCALVFFAAREYMRNVQGCIRHSSVDRIG